MTRLVISTCGVFAEVATLNAAAPLTTALVATSSLVFAAVVWWADLRRVIDRLIGLDL